MQALTRRKYRHDPRCFWIVVELGGESDQEESLEPIRLYCFEDREPATEFVEQMDKPAEEPGNSAGEEPAKPRRHGPYPLLRSPAERAAPLLVAAAELVLAKPVDDNALAFLETAIQLARQDPRLPDVYRDVRRSLLYGSRTPSDDPRFGLEQALKPYLEVKSSLLKEKK